MRHAARRVDFASVALAVAETERMNRKAGLLGWKEYRWILDEAPTFPANSAAFQAAGLSMANPVGDKKTVEPTGKLKDRGDRMAH